MKVIAIVSKEVFNLYYQGRKLKGGILLKLWRTLSLYIPQNKLSLATGRGGP
jgi:hypothetical protein